MPAPRGNTRELMLDSTIALLREHAAPGVSIDAVLAHSGAPRGSVYHHFPGGRDELILDAVRRAGDYLTGYLAAVSPDVRPREMIETFAVVWRQALIESDFRSGCPIVALTVEHRDDLPAARELADEIFRGWLGALQSVLVRHDHSAAAARRLATLAIASIEGAVVLCRAQRSTRPLDDVCTELAEVVDPKEKS